MESTLQLKQSLISAIGDIEDRNIIISIYNYVKGKMRNSTPVARKSAESTGISPEVWAIVKRIHPVDVGDEKKVYYEHLNKKYE